MTAGTSTFEVSSSDPDSIIQMGFWVPNRVWATAKYLLPLRAAMAAKKAESGGIGLNPAVQTLKEWLASNTSYHDLFMDMIGEANAFVLANQEAVEEILADGDYLGTLDGETHLWIRNPDELFELISWIISTSPGYNNTEMVGTPLNGLLAVAMGTPSGFKLFSDPEFNAQLRLVLDAWNTFLKSAESLDKLDINDPEKPGSWISQQAFAAGVWQPMSYDPKQPGFGFASWNDFFIREFEPGARPFQGDADKVLNIGCETTPWKHQNDLKLTDTFDIKGGNYSLIDIFDQDQATAELFVGGQAYQGFLSATHYHRWQAPLDGELVKSWLIEGTYFAQNPSQGENQGTWAGTESQPYLPQVATRAIFLFDHAIFGYVALVCVGMVEVSTCFIEPAYLVPEGANPVAVTRGVDLGHFEFGGSTHMMIFQKDQAQLVDWATNASQYRNDATPQPLGSVIATRPSAVELT